MSWLISALSSLIASISNGTSLSYLTVKYSSLAGAGQTASGRTAWTSCADTPACLNDVSNPSPSPISLKLYVNPRSWSTLSTAFSIGSKLVFNLSSEANAIISPPQDKTLVDELIV